MSGRAGTAGIFIAACGVDVGSCLTADEGSGPETSNTHRFFILFNFLCLKNLKGAN